MQKLLNDTFFTKQGQSQKIKHKTEYYNLQVGCLTKVMHIFWICFVCFSQNDFVIKEAFSQDLGLQFVFMFNWKVKMVTLIFENRTALRTFSKNHYARPSFSQLFIFLSLTPRSVSLRGVTYFANISAKTDLKNKHFNLFARGPDGFIS